MKQSYISNILLLGLLLLLWVLFEKAQHVAQIVPQINTTLSAEQVHRILIQRQGQADIVLERQASKWVVSKPFNAAASESRVNLLLSVLQTPVSRRMPVQDTVQLEAVDLAPPVLSLHLNDQMFHFGGIESISGERYLQYQDFLYLFEDDLSPLLLASAHSFINNRLFDKHEQIKQLMLPTLMGDALQAEPTLTLKYEEGKWQSAEAHADYAANALIAHAWQNAYAMQVVTLDLTDLDNLLPIEIVLMDGTTQQLRVQLTNKGLVLIHPQKQLRYQLPAALAPALFPTMLETP